MVLERGDVLMNQYVSSIPLSDNYKTNIIQAVCDGNKRNIQYFGQENSLPTTNSIHMLKWDYVNRNLIEKLSSEKFVCHKVIRGIWSFILVHDIETDSYYSLMNENNFAKIRKNFPKRVNKARAHYLDALASINFHLQPMVEPVRQGCLFDEDHELWANDVQKVLGKILPGINVEKSTHVLVGFSTRHLDTTAVCAYVLTKDLDIAAVEDWSEFIEADFDSVIDRHEVSEENDDDIPMSIREHILNKTDDISVKVKEEEVGKNQHDV